MMKNLIFNKITGIQPLSKMVLPVFTVKALTTPKIYWSISICPNDKEYDFNPGFRYSETYYLFESKKEAEDFVLIEKLCQ